MQPAQNLNVVRQTVDMTLRVCTCLHMLMFRRLEVRCLLQETVVAEVSTIKSQTSASAKQVEGHHCRLLQV